MPATTSQSASERHLQGPRRAPWRRLLLAIVVVLGLLGLERVAAPASPAPTPPLDGCLATVPFELPTCSGFGPADYGTITSVVQHATTIGTEITLQTEAVDTTTPIQCGEFGCTYRSVNWKWDYVFQTGIQVVSGCATNEFTCVVRYVGLGVGDQAEHWQPVVVREFYAVNPVKGLAHAFYAPPKIYPVNISTATSGGDPYPVRSVAVSFLVRQGTNPDVSECLPFDWYYPYTQSETVPVPDCIVARNQNLSESPTYTGYLPNDSGTWDLLSFDKTIESFSGAVRGPVPQFSAATVTPSGDDMEVEQIFLARPQLDVAIQPSPATVPVGSTAELEVSVTAAGGDAGTIDGIKFSKPTIIGDGFSYAVVGNPDPVPPAAGFSLAQGESREFTVTIQGVGEGNAQTSATATGTTDQGSPRSDTAFVNIQIVPANQTTTTQPSGSAPTPPVVTSAVAGSGGNGTITGTVEGEPNSTRTVALASSGGSTCNKFMSGAGVTTLGSEIVNLDGNGDGTFSFEGPIVTGAFVYGTSSNGASTSAVGDCFVVAPPATTTTSSTTSTTSSTTTPPPTSTTTSTTSTTPPPTSTTTSTTSTTTTAPPTSTTTSTTSSTTTPPPTSTTPPPSTTPTTTPPSSSSTAFVDGLFSGLLGRVTDPSGLAYWSARRDRGASPRAVADGVIASPEFRRLQVREAYEAVLGRTADPAALGYWTARLRAGATVDDLRVALLTSDEAWRRAGSNPSGFTDLLYRSVLGRSPDAGGRSFAVSWIEEGRSLRALATGVVTSDEAFRREADDWYRRLLDRAPSGAETARWLAARRVGTPEWTLLAELAASTA